MTKSNPLFTDSTLLQGDSIGTQIELNRMCLYEGENVYLVLLRPEGSETYLPMEIGEDAVFEVFVRLIHQRPVRFYFGVEKEGELLLKSEIYERVARYALIEDWMPVEEYYPEGRKNSSSVEDVQEQSLEADAEEESDVDEDREVSEDLERTEDLEVAETPLLVENSESVEKEEMSSKSAPILKPDQVNDITMLMEKWGFS